MYIVLFGMGGLMLSLKLKGFDPPYVSTGVCFIKNTCTHEQIIQSIVSSNTILVQYSWQTWYIPTFVSIGGIKNSLLKKCNFQNLICVSTLVQGGGFIVLMTWAEFTVGSLPLFSSLFIFYWISLTLLFPHWFRTSQQVL